MRETTILDDGWKFLQSDAPGARDFDFDDSGWQTVRVPHDWAIAGPFAEENDVQITQVVEDGEATEQKHTGRTGSLPHAGVAWYRRRLALPLEAGRRIRLEFDGVMSHSVVHLNGNRVGEWPYGYSSFAFDITDLPAAGDNLLAVRVDNPPLASRWYPGAGIYRNVRLVVTDAVRIAHWGTSISTPEVSESGATIVVRTRIENSDEPSEIDLETSVVSPSGEVVAGTVESARVGDSHLFEQSFTVAHPSLWSTTSPSLYSIRSVVRTDHTVRDEVATRFGIRSIQFTPDRGFLINGVQDRFKGVCLHHDLGPLGTAVNRSALARQLTILQEMGCNAIRTSHNPPAPELLDLGDEMGFYVICEAFDEWRLAKCENGYHTLFDEWAERDLRAMIRRDRNHPCVVMWSIGNEVRDQTVPEGGEVAKWLTSICHDADPTRPTTAAFNQPDLAIRNGLAASVDVPGWNYEPTNYARLRLEHPEWPMYGSETASTISSRGEYYLPGGEEKPPARGNQQVNSFDLCTTEWSTTPDQEFSALDENQSLMGEFVWTGFDYLGEPTPYGWPSRSSYFGIVDLGGIPKSRFWLYKSRWSKEPVLYIHPHWSWSGQDGQSIPVHCYTNHASVELFVNGVSAGRRRKSEKTLMNRHRLVWSGVTYEPGELKAIAYDESGAAVAQTIVQTAGGAARIALSADREQITADGNAMAFVRVTIVDGHGVTVPNADLEINFSITGSAEIAGVCNGDPTDSRSLAGSTMALFHGECVVYLRSLAEGAGVATLSASTSDGTQPALARATVSIQVE